MDHVKSEKEKRETILQACKEHDITKLIQLADSPGGFLDDEVRRDACKYVHSAAGVVSIVLIGHGTGPQLLHSTSDEAANKPSLKDWESLQPHRDEEQVQRDVDRAFVYYPNTESEAKTKSNKARLFNLIVAILRTHPMLCYFQGYHDIVQVLLLVLGETKARSAVAKLSLCRIRDYMLPSLTPAIKHLRLIPGILQLADPELARRLSQTEPFFALSATLTLYAHDIQEYSDIARLYDFLLAHEPVMTIYLFASIILRRRSELLDIPLDEPEMLHFTLSKLPHPLDLEALLSATLSLYQKHPPEELPKGVWRKISPYSVLKTARHVEGEQNLQEAEKLFEQQERQLAREEYIKRGLIYIAKNKVPIASVSTALLVGVLAIWLGRTGSDRIVSTGVWHMISTVWRR